MSVFLNKPLSTAIGVFLPAGSSLMRRHNSPPASFGIRTSMTIAWGFSL